MNENRNCSFGDISSSKDSHKNMQDHAETIPLSSSTYLIKNTQIFSSQLDSHSPIQKQSNEILLSNKTSQNFNEEYVQRVLNQVLANAKPVDEYPQSQNGGIVSFGSSFSKPKQYENSKIAFCDDYSDKNKIPAYDNWQSEDKPYNLSHQNLPQSNNYPEDLFHFPKYIDNILDQSKYSHIDNYTQQNGNTQYNVPSSNIDLAVTNSAQTAQIKDNTQLINGTAGQQQTNQFSNDFISRSNYVDTQYQSTPYGEQQSPYQIISSSGQYYTPKKPQTGDIQIDSSSLKYPTPLDNNNNKPSLEINENLYPSLASVQVPNKNAMASSPVGNQKSSTNERYQESLVLKQMSQLQDHDSKEIKDKRENLNKSNEQQLKVEIIGQDREKLLSEIDSLMAMQKLEIEKIKENAEKECERYNLMLQKTIETFELRVRSENQTYSTTEICQQLRSKLADDIGQLKSQRMRTGQYTEEQKLELESQKRFNGKQINLGNQVEGQEKTIQRLKQVQSAFDKLQQQFTELSANLADTTHRLKEKEKENIELKQKRDAERKKEKGKYDEVLGKLNSQDSKQEQLKKDFERKSATIIKELLNKDIKIRELQGKLHPRGCERNEKDRSSPLNRLLQEEKQVQENSVQIEVNKSQIIQGNDKVNFKDSGDRKNSRSKSPMSDKKNNDSAAQYWQKFMDSSNITQQVDQTHSLEQSNITNKQDSPQRHEQLSHNYLTASQNSSNLKSSIQTTKEIHLKKELRFVIEQCIEILANLIVADLREKGKTLSDLNEEKIVKEADKQLKSILIKLKETAIQSSMAECFNILEAIVSNVGNRNYSNQKKSGSKNTIQYLSDHKNKNKTNGNLNSPTLTVTQQAQDEVKRKLFGNTNSSVNGSNLINQNQTTLNTSSHQPSRRITIGGQTPQSQSMMLLSNHNDLSPRGYFHQLTTITNSSKLTDAVKEIKKKSVSPSKTSTGKRGSQKFSNYFQKQYIRRPSASPKKGSDSTDEVNTPNNLSAIQLH